jgi:hypothetical protein
MSWREKCRAAHSGMARTAATVRDEKLIGHQLPNNRVGALLGFMNLESVLFRHQSCPRLLHRFDVWNLPAVVEERLAFVP